MPYYCIWNLDHDGRDTEWSTCAYDLVAAAGRWRRLFGCRVEVRREPDEETAERLWRVREQSKLDDGTYRPVPWHRADFVVSDHYAHVSVKDPTMLAYTPDSKAGVADRQLTIKPGRYLARLGLPNEQVKHWCDQWALANVTPVLKISASDPDEIERIYVKGPNSCMSKPADHPDYDSPCHPVRVYGAGDLCVAYLEPTKNRITARALCWPERQVYGRIYGDAGKLEPLLRDAGYTDISWSNGDFADARLQRIEHRGRFVAPYLDSPHDRVRDDGDYLVIADEGEIECRETNGLSENKRAVCCHCGDRFDIEDSGQTDDDGDDWCYDCYGDHHFRCEHCDCEFHTICRTVVGDEDWCGDCAHGHAFVCDGCGDRFSNDQRHARPAGVFCGDCLSADAENDDDAEPSPTVNDPRQESLPLEQPSTPRYGVSPAFLALRTWYGTMGETENE